MTSLSWNRTGTLLAVGHQDTCIRLWTPEGHLVTTLFGHKAPVFDVAWSETGKLLVSAGLDSLACIWDTSQPGSTKLSHTCTGHRSLSLSFHIRYNVM
jgi:WD40 repeat protein